MDRLDGRLVKMEALVKKGEVKEGVESLKEIITILYNRCVDLEKENRMLKAELAEKKIAVVPEPIKRKKRKNVEPKVNVAITFKAQTLADYSEKTTPRPKKFNENDAITFNKSTWSHIGSPILEMDGYRFSKSKIILRGNDEKWGCTASANGKKCSASVRIIAGTLRGWIQHSTHINHSVSEAPKGPGILCHYCEREFSFNNMHRHRIICHKRAEYTNDVGMCKELASVWTSNEPIDVKEVLAEYKQFFVGESAAPECSVYGVRKLNEFPFYFGRTAKMSSRKSGHEKDLLKSEAWSDEETRGLLAESRKALDFFIIADGLSLLESKCLEYLLIILIDSDLLKNRCVPYECLPPMMWKVRGRSKNLSETPICLS